MSHDEDKVSTATKKIIEDEVKKILKVSYNGIYPLCLHIRRE